MTASNSITVRLHLDSRPGLLAKALQAVGDQDGDVGAIDIVRADAEHTVRDVTIETLDEAHAERVVAALSQVPGVEVASWSDRTFLLHLGGKIEINSKTPVRTRDQLSMVYTPGVARVCRAIAADPAAAWNLTIKRNTVAVVSDGSAVLGLGNIGPLAAMPVMEGKAQLFKEFAGVDAFPICLDTQDTEAVIAAVTALAPGFGGINLEDIAAPRCFEIERRLQEALDIPVFHDDQHGTAVVLAAAFLNALKLTGKRAEDLKVVVAGVGAAGTACTEILLELGVSNIIGCDRGGALSRTRRDLNSAKQAYLERTNPHDEAGDLHSVLRGADVFIGLSGPNLIGADDLKAMARDPVVFAMSNPDPEIDPQVALPLVAIMATGRSDYPNQINNVLCFPGLFRGALDCRARRVTPNMKLAAARAIAEVIPEQALLPDYIIPSVFDPAVAPAVAEAVKQAARDDGVARH
ncbi:MAG TPA: NAD-dependent malic enzyme [Gammaproteobacteria bacterium]|uniref:NAD-dependent malic enzyme n=1 Tax=Immundisolibacter sp. TaxID=1934948 RepID=UPI000E8F0AE7|nr:NAD-dependent malic enzyme [Gammaproteobacteria bacterium]MCH77084.1 NAD-dependent malic enzyme [Gammaproteobacteria bacterium]